MTRGTISLVLGLAVLLLAACGQATSRGGDSPDALGPALEQALRQPSRLDRIRQLSAGLERLDTSNLNEALGVYEREHWWLKETEIRLFLESWSRFDPEAAADYAVRWPFRARRGEAMAAALRGWALRDPQAAMERAQELGQAYPRIRVKLIEAVLTGWVESGQPGVVDRMAAAPEGSWPYNAMVVAGAKVRLAGVADSIAWAEGIVTSELPDELKKQIFRRVTGMAARLDPEAVAAWVAKHDGQGYADQGPRLLVERWVARDPDAAIHWVSESVPADERSAMLRGAFTKWLTGSFEEASAWVEVAPQEPRHDAAFAAYANVLAQRDPESALPWSERVQEEKLRLVSLERVASAWYRRDPVGAETWLQASELDEEARERVRAAPGRRPQRPLEDS